MLQPVLNLTGTTTVTSGNARDESASEDSSSSHSSIATASNDTATESDLDGWSQMSSYDRELLDAMNAQRRELRDQRLREQSAAGQNKSFERPRTHDSNDINPSPAKSILSRPEKREASSGNVPAPQLSGTTTQPLQVEFDIPVVDEKNCPQAWDKSHEKEFGEWTLNHHQQGLLEKHPISTSAAGSSGHVSINFAELHRMRLRKLQIKLVHQAVNMRYTGVEADGWEETLEQYSEYFINTISYHQIFLT
jgi:hypothetical protein